MDLEIVILSKVRQRQISYDIMQTRNPLFKKRKEMKLLQNKNRLTDIENKLSGEG